MPEVIYKKPTFESVRVHFDENTNEWYFSIVDIIEATGKSSNSRNYWKVLKNRLNKAQNKLVTKCNQLKMKANDGKLYLTDTADQDTIIEIIKIVSLDYVPYFMDWCETLEVPAHIKSQNTTNPFLINKNETQENSPSYPQVKINLKENHKENNISINAHDTESDISEDTDELMLLVDGYTKDNNVFIKAFIGGVSIEDLSISVSDDEVSIKGKRRLNPKYIVEENYIQRELVWGVFSRTIKLPHQVKISEATAIENNGLLTIKIPILNKVNLKVIKMKTI